MIRPIPLKMTTVNLTTGEESTSTAQAFVMTANPKPGECAECLKAHPPTEPHDALSISYQYAFFAQHERFPDWRDAMAHCPEDVRAAWTASLEEIGVDVAGGRLLPGGPEVCEPGHDWEDETLHGDTFTPEEVAAAIEPDGDEAPVSRTGAEPHDHVEVDITFPSLTYSDKAAEPSDAELDAAIGREDDAYWSKHEAQLEDSGVRPCGPDCPCGEER